MLYKWYNVKEMYENTSNIARPLLSNYDKAFWAEYVLNYDKYDKLFRNMYKSFRYYDQDPFVESTVEEITDEFVESVYLHLMANDKKYSELFKLYQLNDSNMLNDFYVEEVTNAGRNINSTYVSGSREDITTEKDGIRNSSDDRYVMAFNSTDYVPESKTEHTSTSATEDVSRYTKGIETDTDQRQEVANNKTVTKGFKENPSKNAREFIKTWNSYEFYSYIFKQIAKELLLV